MSVIWALISDTFQEARARWLFWGLFALSTLLVLLLLLALQVDLTAGAISFMGIENTSRRIYNIEKFVLVSYSWVSIVLYVWGTFLAVFASSGVIPSVLEAGRISLLLSKPISRVTLLMGRFLGNLFVVMLNHVYLVGSVWLILGWKTHVWSPRFLLAIPISVFIFAVLLCVVVLMGVLSESAALSVMVPIAIALLSTILAQRQFVLRLFDSEWARQLWTSIYWIIPKVYDLGNSMRQIILFDRQADLWTPVWTSTLFGVAILMGAIYLFQKRDF
jgi:ABC-type transport system involved in multi-copper enzyme maturation permease subunit